MATQVSAAAAADNAYRTLGLYTRMFTVPVDALVTAATDDIEMLPILAGETVMDVVIVPLGDMDTGAAALRFDVGDSDDPDQYIVAIDPGAGGGTAFKATVGHGTHYAADNKLVLTASTAAGGTAAAGSVLVIMYLQAD